MKKKLLTPSLFVFLMSLSTLLILLVSVGYVLYVCGNVRWLAWTAQPPYSTIFDFLLLFGIPFWFGKKCIFLTNRDVFLYGMGLDFGLGVLGNIISMLNWRFFLMGCMPDKFTYSGFQTMTIASWFVLPLGAFLGGVAAWIGSRWGNRQSQKAKQNKR